MNDSKLKPCPFCGDTEPTMESECDRDATRWHWAYCLDCFTRGPQKRKEAAARDAWNRRHGGNVETLGDLLTACSDLRAARDERIARTRAVQELASVARRTGESQRETLRRLNIQPRVWDVGDAVARILEALERYEASCE